MKFVKPTVLDISWRKESTYTDSGIFAMRHMETYDGSGSRSFKCGFEKKGIEEQQMLDDLRRKYVTKILLSDINLNRDAFINEVNTYEKLPGYEKQRLKKDANKKIQERLCNID